MSLYPAINKKQADAQQAQVLPDAETLRLELNKDGSTGTISQDPISPGTIPQDTNSTGAVSHESPILVVLCGLPGTGKSHFARELTKLLPFRVLESDRIRKALVAKPQYTRGEHSRVFKVCHYLIEEYLGESQRVLFDATNLTENFRLPLRQISQRQNARLVFVHLEAPRDLIRQRLQRREKERETGNRPGNYSDAGWLIYCRLAPYDEPIEGDHLSVDTSTDISGTVNDVVRLATESD